MKFTLLIRSKRIRFVRHVGARSMVSCAVLLSLIALVSSRSTESVDENLARIQMVKSGLLIEQERVGNLYQQTLDELLVVKRQLASMEARLREVDLKSQHVAEQSGIDYPELQSPVAESDLSIDASDLEQHPIFSTITTMQAQLADKLQQLDALESVLMGHHIQDVSDVAGRPIQSGWLSSYYGMRDDPFTGKPAMHKGLDFAGKTGDPVIATAAGLVTWSGERYGYGNMVEIDHGNGLVSRYAHNAELTVVMGEVVTKGQVIAKMGSTGRSTGAHVHYEVLKKGQQIDPLPFVY
ncbi:M23 family metallopeptidase [Alteromonas sp. ASW11-36]|uniref:M23 family metallopeptidase n=1 Tax=Alteromonas arenosi TaxID=3055817 RepID=A0ABT7STM3_9ALTE|nr:M23 family metallopeptidase [Alteromonas sp. ASW11-36]MDM7859537.1 M23 family metallopeptidase [Alteromonas sp. ASW11-36]